MRLKPDEDTAKRLFDAIGRLVAKRDMPDVKPLELSEVGQPFLPYGDTGREWMTTEARGIPKWLSGLVVSLDEWPMRIAEQDRVGVPTLDAKGRLTAVEFRVRMPDGKKIVQLYRPFSDDQWRVS